MESHNRILLVEDEKIFNEVVKSQLTKNGFNVDSVLNAEEGEQLFKKHKYDLVLLDIYLPGENGFQLCKKFRDINPAVPILMFSSQGDVNHKLDAFSLGADDYIVKPFHINELIARMKVFIKRSLSAVQENEVEQLEVEDLSIDLKHKIVKRAGTEIALTAKEFGLLVLLAKNNGAVVSKQEILEKVWDLSFDTGTNSIEVYINFLRNKLDKPFEHKLIHTKPGFGYFLKKKEA
ncbi:MAG: response regulator transcription factor [Chitinophagaceae bacterium]|jgi:two-component system copper resistance phosphate regulon response regulator CusR|nr:response regulator transcription factor [Chitinophagaceae bacterium]HAK12091.1 DNA-binding response regulator [Chitinophagaceae bacterium]HCT23002.1 DNA-binding response regulator [Chitinophagaceae bacterium]